MLQQATTNTSTHAAGKANIWNLMVIVVFICHLCDDGDDHHNWFPRGIWQMDKREEFAKLKEELVRQRPRVYRVGGDES